MKQLEVNYNYKQILQLIISSGGISRAQIARDTNLNRSTISYIITYFLENNIVFETSEKVLTGGRASKLIKFNYDIEEIMLIDFQKNKIKVLITTYSGKFIDRFDFPIVHDESINTEYIQSMISKVVDKYPDIHKCGVAIHGIVSTSKNIISSPFYSYQFEDVVNIFTKFNFDLYIENEANIYTNGILVTKNLGDVNLLNIHIKDGIGSGQVLNGLLYRGDNGFAGEIGHSILFPNGDKCRCGNNGCLELYTSERYFIKQIERITGDHYKPADISMLVQNNQQIKQVYEQIIVHLGIKINDLILFTDVSELYITSDLFNEVVGFKDDLLNQLHSKNYIKPNISVISADIEIFAAGFARIILQNQFGLS